MGKELLEIPPDTPVYTGSVTDIGCHIKLLLYYNGSELIKKTDLTVEQLKDFKFHKGYTYWISIVGLNDTEKVQEIGKIFELHDLTVEDIVNVHERPKIEDFDDYLFVVVKELLFDRESLKIDFRHIPMVLKDNIFITFSEEWTGIFDFLLKRLEKSKSRLRQRKSDYLCFSAIDVVIDKYFKIFEEIGEVVEDMEDRVLKEPDETLVEQVHYLKRELIFVRRNIWPLREIINDIIKADYTFIYEPTKVYFRDAYDHTIQIIDTLESFRDILSGLLDVYLSSLSNKMNEIMKTLSIIGTIFIPLTFIAGNYGMNFRYMPELYWHYGYFAVLISYVVIASGLIIFFKKRKWF
ncbi:magnesium/cobalt transporter CorA [Persephonella atlantica]|uniref:Magnesium transport protein CorA n=1 Tax=Persephonella atlantica TaxID=2699429 RepID=A0ABS1GG95_9AQUI|nr:magnesium/cobalt transporter CorA [Persephonella atlantica]MBK3331943.1 magnesium/cobalt transporter CorA [Persephonella atlantica]